MATRNTHEYPLKLPCPDRPGPPQDQLGSSALIGVSAVGAVRWPVSEGWWSWCPLLSEDQTLSVRRMESANARNGHCQTIKGCAELGLCRWEATPIDVPCWLGFDVHLTPQNLSGTKCPMSS